MHRKIRLGLLIVISAHTWPDFAGAQIPRQISHQGVVTANGQRFNGTGIFRFALVDASGNYLWANDDNNPPISAPTTDVTIINIVDGIYSVSLGAPPMNSLPPSAFTSSDIRIRVWFNDGVHNLQQLSPDQSIGSVPFAFNGVPPGTIIAFAGSTVPNGWLPCNGISVSRTTYPALFSAIGTAWGSGDNATTFHIPDLRGLFLRGVLGTGPPGWDPDSDSRGPIQIGGNSGNQVGSWQGSQFASHNHGVNDPGHNHAADRRGPTGALTSTFEGGGSGGDQGAIGTHVATTGITIASNGGNETRPVSAYVTYIIKY